MLCDWQSYLAPLYQLIRSETKTYDDLLAPFSRASHLLHVFASVSDWFSGLSASVVIGQSNHLVTNATTRV